MRYQWKMLMLLALVAWPVQLLAQVPATVLARAKAGSGDARWDTVRTLQAEGEEAAGGLRGGWQLLQDLSGGRYVETVQQGPFTLAHGYDGQQAWRRERGGEVGLLDGQVARRSAYTQAWLGARAYWYPTRIAAALGAARMQQVAGRRYAVLAATPAGGDRLELWFDAGSGRLSRLVQPLATGSMLTVLDDYREVDGLQLPHRISIDTLDNAGQADPRLRRDLRVQRYTVNAVLAGDAFDAPPMPTDAYVATASGATRIGFDLVNNHVYVDAEVDGQPARLLVDTGAVNLLTPTAARRLGIATVGRSAVNGAGDKAAEVGLAQGQHLRIGDAHLPHPVFHVIDLGEQIKSMGVHYDGFIGYETFRRFATTFDYAGRVLTLTEPARYQPPADAVALVFEQDDRAPILSGTLDGIALRLWVDSGSRNSLSLLGPFVRTHGLREKYQAGDETVLGWGIGGPSRAAAVRLGVLQLGSLQVRGLAGDLLSTDQGALATPNYGALLGGGLLRRFTVGLDYAAKRMYFTPNADNAAPEPFDRSGLWLQAEGALLRIGDVAPGSAGAQAQLREDDRVVSIQGEPVARRSLGQWRERLRDLPVGTRIAIDYVRGGQQGEATLTLTERIAERWLPH